MLVFFTNLSLMEFHVRYLALFLLFSVIGCFGWFWIGNLHKNEYPVNARVSQGSILGPTLFLLYINVLMNWLLNLNQIYETLWTGAGRGLFIAMLEILSWFHLTGLVTLVLLI